MMPSKQSEAVRKHWEAARLAVTRPGADGPDDESWGDLTAEPREVDYLETEAGGVPAMWAVPKHSRPDRVLLCLHGGGFVSGSVYTHRKMFGHLAKAAGARALLPGYRLLPEGGAYTAIGQRRHHGTCASELPEPDRIALASRDADHDHVGACAHRGHVPAEAGADRQRPPHGVRVAGIWEWSTARSAPRASWWRRRGCCR